MKRLRLSFNVFAFVVPILFVCGIAAAGDDGRRFGLWCQKSFEGRPDPWLSTIEYANNRCNNFSNQMDNTTPRYFYFNLHGAQSHFYEDQYGENLDTDNVDLCVVHSHGGSNSIEAWISMWDWYTRAYFQNMRLGDDGRQLSILSQYVCSTLNNSDGKFGTRTANAWRGGLKYMTGSHDGLVSSYWTDDCLADYAEYLQDGDKIKYAWRDGMYDTYEYQDIAVFATGSATYICDYRRDNMRWSNFDDNTTFPRLRDNTLKNACGSFWTDY